MTENNVVTFSDLGTADRVLVNDGYTGFTWRSYNFLNQEFERALYVYTGDRIGAPQSHSICAWGFQLETTDRNVAFRANSLVVASVHHGLISHISVKGFFDEHEIFHESFSIGEQNTIALNTSLINRLELTTDSADMFWANNISITLENNIQGNPAIISAVA